MLSQHGYTSREMSQHVYIGHGEATTRYVAHIQHIGLHGLVYIALCVPQFAFIPRDSSRDSRDLGVIGPPNGMSQHGGNILLWRNLTLHKLGFKYLRQHFIARQHAERLIYATANSYISRASQEYRDISSRCFSLSWMKLKVSPNTRLHCASVASVLSR